MFSGMKSIQIARDALNDAIQQAKHEPVHPGLRAALITGLTGTELAEKLAALTPVERAA